MSDKQLAQRYKNKVVIVTGGAGHGIGYGIAKTFVQHGAKVVICDLKEEEGKKNEKELNAEGPGECIFLTCDVREEDQIKGVVEKTVETYGRLDCLVNNAGIHPPHHPIDEFSSSDFRKLLDINVVAFFSFSKYALPHLRKVKGNIINNCSLVASIAQYWAVTYVASKGAVLSMTKALAIDEALHNVRVNSFSPSNVWSPMWEQAAMAAPDYDEAVKKGADAQLLGRYGTLEECGLLCLFLAADATFCTGININLTGGSELDYGKKSRFDSASAE